MHDAHTLCTELAKQSCRVLQAHAMETVTSVLVRGAAELLNAIFSLWKEHHGSEARGPGCRGHLAQVRIESLFPRGARAWVDCWTEWFSMSF